MRHKPCMCYTENHDVMMPTLTSIYGAKSDDKFDIMATVDSHDTENRELS